MALTNTHNHRRWRDKSMLRAIEAGNFVICDIEHELELKHIQQLENIKNIYVSDDTNRSQSVLSI